MRTSKRAAAILTSVVGVVAATILTAGTANAEPGPGCGSAIAKYYTAVGAGAAAGGPGGMLAGAATAYQNMIEQCGSPPPDSYNTT